MVPKTSIVATQTRALSRHGLDPVLKGVVTGMESQFGTGLLQLSRPGFTSPSTTIESLVQTATRTLARRSGLSPMLAPAAADSVRGAMWQFGWKPFAISGYSRRDALFLAS